MLSIEIDEDETGALSVTYSGGIAVFGLDLDTPQTVVFPAEAVRGFLETMGPLVAMWASDGEAVMAAFADSAIVIPDTPDEVTP